MATESFQMNSVGPVFRMTCKVGVNVLPIQTATIKKIIFLPKGEVEARIMDGEFPAGGDGSDGKLQYRFADGDLNVSGEWKAQAYIEFSETEYYYSTQVSFEVANNLGVVP